MTPHRHPIHQSFCLRYSRLGKVKTVAARLYIRRLPNVSSISLTSIQLFIIFEMATMGGDVTEEITSEVSLFGLIMQQNIIENKFNREYAPLATIQHGAPSEFMVKGSNDLYLDLNNSRLHVLVKITNEDGSNIGANTADPINLPLHSMFREISLELNGRNVSDTSPLYPFRAYLETLLNFSKETQDTRLQCEGWTKDSSGNMGVTEVAGTNAGLNTRAVTFATSIVVELVGRHYLDVFHQDRLIHSVIDLRMKLIPAADSFVCKSAAPGEGAAQQNYKMAIQRGSYYQHQTAYKHGPKGSHGAPPSPQYADALFTRPGQAPVNPREPNLDQLRQRFNRRTTGHGHYWSGERRGPRGRLLKKTRSIFKISA